MLRQFFKLHTQNRGSLHLAPEHLHNLYHLIQRNKLDDLKSVLKLSDLKCSLKTEDCGYYTSRRPSRVESVGEGSNDEDEIAFYKTDYEDWQRRTTVIQVVVVDDDGISSTFQTRVPTQAIEDYATSCSIANGNSFLINKCRYSLEITVQDPAVSKESIALKRATSRRCRSYPSLLAHRMPGVPKCSLPPLTPLRRCASNLPS